MTTDLTEFIRLVRAMRQSQRAYFRERTPLNLDTAKKLEKAVDAAINRLSQRTGKSLFDESEETK